jgi:hypothetical protein
MSCKKHLFMENNAAYDEGFLTEEIEKQTAKLPSDLFLFAALASMGLALSLGCLRQKHLALFVGQWAAPFLLLGVYNKIVKIEGHDRNDKKRVEASVG